MSNGNIRAFTASYYEQRIARQACKVWRIRQALESAMIELDVLTRQAPPYLHHDGEVVYPSKECPEGREAIER